MEQFLQLALSFPVLPYSLVMGVVFLYWLAVILGQVDLDLLDGDGAAEVLSGKAEALGGKLEALAGKAEALGGKVEALAGKAEALAGKTEALAGKAEALTGKADALGAEGEGLLDVLGLGGVPLTVAGSALTFTGWSASLLGMHWLSPYFPEMLPDVLLKTGVFVGATGVAWVLSSLAVRPLRPIFRFRHAPTRQTLMGKVCVIESGSVDGRYGQATLQDGGAGLRLHVVCDRKNPLKRGDRALIIDFDAKREVYEVEPVDWLLPQELGELAEPSVAQQLARSQSERSP